MITPEEYNKAVEVAKNHRVCPGCSNIFELKDTHYTVQYGQEKWWCKPCYEKIKNDW